MGHHNVEQVLLLIWSFKFLRGFSNLIIYKIKLESNWQIGAEPMFHYPRSFTKSSYFILLKTFVNVEETCFQPQIAYFRLP